MESLFEDPDAFITTWEIPNADFELEIGINPNLEYDFTIDWGDGSDPESFVDISENPTHVYAAGGTHHVAITGTFPQLINGNIVPPASREALVDVAQWGAITWSSMEAMFASCDNLVEFSAIDQPNLDNVESMVSMFFGAISFNGDIGSWNVSNVNNMSGMFANAFNFNQNIGGWNVSIVTDMSNMFGAASDFNQNISGWNVSKVTDMEGMFLNAFDFNQDIGGWAVSNVADMNQMFTNANAFNQNISGWDVSNVADFGNMFRGADIFDQNLGQWEITSANSDLEGGMANMFDDSGMSARNFSDTIIGWATLGDDLPQDIILGVDNINHCSEVQVIQELVNFIGKGWDFQGSLEQVFCE
ncbi:MAG: BspA family leucine-rich repeat surface protein [Bacteroidota bacterium]